jgi:hypothetical protein
MYTKEIEGGRQSTMGDWEFKDTEPFELEIFEDGKLRFKYGVLLFPMMK